MLDLDLALQLKEAGLEWHPAERDLFILPDSELAHEPFMVSDRTTLVQNINGQWMITFHGVVEWALDSVLLSDVVWIPTETQLREAIQLRLGGEQPRVSLTWQLSGYQCTFTHFDQAHMFDQSTAERAYAQALLFLLRAKKAPSSGTEQA
jgi:hypothetical protein